MASSIKHLAALNTFWKDVKDWIDSSAVTVVEKEIGYSALGRIHKAVCTIDAEGGMLRNSTVIYVKREELDNTYDKVTLQAEAPETEVSREVLEEIALMGCLVEEFDYKRL
jgi:hypothetical protein